MSNLREWIVTMESGDTCVDPGQSRMIKVQPQVLFRALKYSPDPRFAVEEFYFLDERTYTKRDMLERFSAGEKLLTTEPCEYMVMVVRNKSATPIHYRLDFHGKAVL